MKIINRSLLAAFCFAVILAQPVLALWDTDPAIGDSWRRSEWLGDYAPSATTAWVYHLDHGWIYPLGTDAENFWYYDTGLGWMWTTETIYPRAFSATRRNFLEYFPGTHAPRRFLDIQQGREITDGRFIPVERVRQQIGNAAVRVAVAGGPFIDIPEEVAAVVDTAIIGELGDVVPEVHPDAIEGGTIYDFDLGLGHAELPAPVRIAIPYDSARIPDGKSPEQSLMAAFYDEQQGLWVIVPTVVDAENGTLAVDTYHLSLWRAYYLRSGYLVMDSSEGHFRAVYKFGDSVIVGSQTWQSGGTASFALRHLEAARTAYINAGFKVPSGVTWLFVDPTNHTSYYTGTTGSICLASNFDDQAMLRHELSHEFFHAVQSQYFNSSFTMNLRLWWVEACADYAAEFIGDGKWGYCATQLKPNFLSYALNSTVGDRHYALSNLITFLVWTENVSFKDLWVETTSAARGPLAAIEKYLRESPTANESIFSLKFVEFAEEFLFGAGEPMPDLDPYASPPLEARIAMPDIGSRSHTFSVDGPYSAKLIEIVPENADSPLTMVISVDQGAPASHVGVYRFPASNRNFLSFYRLAELRAGDSFEVTTDKDHHLAVVAFNTSNLSYTKNITVNIQTGNTLKTNLSASFSEEPNAMRKTLSLALDGSGFIVTDPTYDLMILDAVTSGANGGKDIRIFGLGDGSVPVSLEFYYNLTSQVNDFLKGYVVQTIPTSWKAPMEEGGNPPPPAHHFRRVDVSGVRTEITDYSDTSVSVQTVGRVQLKLDAGNPDRIYNLGVKLAWDYTILHIKEVEDLDGTVHEEIVDQVSGSAERFIFSVYAH